MSYYLSRMLEQLSLSLSLCFNNNNKSKVLYHSRGHHIPSCNEPSSQFPDVPRPMNPEGHWCHLLTFAPYPLTSPSLLLIPLRPFDTNTNVMDCLYLPVIAIMPHAVIVLYVVCTIFGGNCWFFFLKLAWIWVGIFLNAPILLHTYNMYDI